MGPHSPAHPLYWTTPFDRGSRHLHCSDRQPRDQQLRCALYVTRARTGRNAEGMSIWASVSARWTVLRRNSFGVPSTAAEQW